MPSRAEVVACIPTYRRPQELKRLLISLKGQCIPADMPVGLCVLVVDNNPEGDAREVVEEVRPGFPFPLRHVHEPRRGISQARNRALDETAGADFIAFIDDDEVAAPDWIGSLLDMQRRTGADAVMGRVLVRFDGPAPRWAVRGGFFEQRRHGDGAVLDYGYTSNVLLDRQAFGRAGLRFDDALGLTGGEDLIFFDEAIRRGLTIRWADHAVVTDVIPAARISLGWLLRRWYRTGNTDALLTQRRRPGPRGRAQSMGKGVLRLGLGLAAATAETVMIAGGRSHRPIRRLYTASRGAGMISASLGHRYREYG